MLVRDWAHQGGDFQDWVARTGREDQCLDQLSGGELPAVVVIAKGGDAERDEQVTSAVPAGGSGTALCRLLESHKASQVPLRDWRLRPVRR